eukprot:TRINITY_DN16086_c0_g1_i1.p1 TRINITY_DN16086_c0_g1~~TRINITY_DN16086_c0_g1_i1.p1  ORF type:complete len:101 (+),score=13.13 TRINITY_DN16086_c0_g1_i1:86-388(+)
MNAQPFSTDDENELRRKLEELLVQMPSVTGEACTTSQTLLPPQPKRVWAISPPPSPPEGWEPRKEDGPNKITYQDLTETQVGGVTIILPGSENTPLIKLN